MEIFIRSRGQRLTPTFAEQVQRQLELALRRFQSRIGDVRVRLSDASGRRGRVHKRCRISVGLNGLGTVSSEDTHENIVNAINRAANRAHEGVIRAIDRAREWDVRSLQPAVVRI